MELLTCIYLFLLLLTCLIIYQVAKSQQKHNEIIRQLASQAIAFVPIPNLVLQAFRGKRHDVFEAELVEKHGKVFGINFMSSKTIFIAEPELAQLILSKEFTSFTNRREMPFKDKLFSNLLTTVQDENWKRIRSIVTPTFSSGKLRQMKPRLDDSLKTLLVHFEEAQIKPASDGVINVKELFGAYSMDTIIQVAFGTKVDSLSEPNNAIIRNSKKIFSRDISIGQIVLIFFFYFVPKLAMKVSKYLGLSDWADFFTDFTLQIIRERREKLKSSETPPGKANNFLEMLLEAEAENEAMNVQNSRIDETASKKAVKFMTNDEMIAQCIQFFLAAYDTTTTTISLCAYLLALNPSIQERLYEEIAENIEKLQKSQDSADGPDEVDPITLITFESLSQFEYLNAVISETLRLFPPISTERTASRDITLQSEDGQLEVNLKKGDIIRFPVYAMHQDPVQFPQPELFNPDRFLGNPTFHKYSYLPFGAGPRNCVARSLALIEAKMAILAVVHKYRLNVCSQTAVPVQFHANGQILTPRDVILKVQRR